MNENLKVVTLPDADEIVSRLKKITDDPLSHKVYEIVATQGGSEKNASDICTMFTSAVNNVADSDILVITTGMFIPLWINALIDDKDVVEQCQQILSKPNMKSVSKSETTQLEVSLEPPVTNKIQARAILEKWLRDHNYHDEIRILTSYGFRDNYRGKYYDFDVLKPYGVFLVFVDGTVEDNYQVIVKKTTK